MLPDTVIRTSAGKDCGRISFSLIQRSEVLKLDIRFERRRSARSRPDAVLLDAAGTLIRPREPVGETYSRLAGSFGADVEPDRLMQAFDKVFGDMPPMASYHSVNATSIQNEVSTMSEHIHYVTDDTFEQEVLQSPMPVLVDYWADWCGPCKMISPILDEVAKEYAGRLKVCKLNIDENQQVPPKYGIRGIPTLMIFKNGNVEATKVGALSKSQLTAFVDSNI